MSGRSRKKAAAQLSRQPASSAGERPVVKDFRRLESESRSVGFNDRWLVPGICLFLATLVWLVFGQTRHHEFVNYDDDHYVYENPSVFRGPNLKGVEWAFTHTVESTWHPLTIMSHMLDCQWYGLNAGGHHLTNVLLHLATVILLFLVLRRMTGFLWRSAFVAAVFAIHPLHVESVAWVAERKDVLSGLFFMLTLWAYTRYVASDKWQRARTDPALSSATRHPSLFYCLVLLFFALDLMCKPMVVTLPFVLLLLDYWPFQRFAPPASDPAATGKMDALKKHSFPRGLIREKIPLLALSGAACVATLLAQKDIIMPVPPALRIGNAVVSYVVYLRQMIWPADLAVLYPYPQAGFSGWEITLAVVLLAAISTGVYLRRQAQPYLLMGWLWYLGMLVPAIGLVQSGLRAHADRYTYLPQIGLYFALAWAAADWRAGWRHRRLVLGGLATVILAALIFRARAQTACWRNSETLWTHTLACTSDNYVAQNNLGFALFKQGLVDEAIAHYQKALQINPDNLEACYNLGNALIQKGRVDEAVIYYQKALQINPDSAEAHNNFGNALLKMGRVDEALRHYQQALQINPDYIEAHINLGSALLQKGRADEAMVHFQKALQINPGSAEAQNNLGNALLKMGRINEALLHYQKALQINPSYAEVYINLGYTLLQKGEEDDALAHFQKALQINPSYAEVRNTLAALLLKRGRVAEAITQYQTTLQIKPDSPDVLNNLAWLLATSADAHLRNGVQAVRYAGRACELTRFGTPTLVGTLAAAYAEAGRFDEAIASAQKACALASEADEPALLERNQELLALYRARQPYHETDGKFVPATH